jgi:hypothetical protein
LFGNASLYRVALVLVATLLTINGCRHATAPQCVPTHDTTYFKGDTLIFQLGRRCPNN